MDCSPHQRRLQAQPDQKDDRLSWENYLDIARKLEAHYPHIDVLPLKFRDLKDLIDSLPEFDTPCGSPDRFTIDDIRFAWLFLRSKDKENQNTLVSKFSG